MINKAASNHTETWFTGKLRVCFTAAGDESARAVQSNNNQKCITVEKGKVLFVQGLLLGQLNLFSIHNNVASLTRPLHTEEQQHWSATLLLGWVFLKRYKMAECVERSLSDELGDWSSLDNSGSVRHEEDCDWIRRVESKGRYSWGGRNCVSRILVVLFCVFEKWTSHLGNRVFCSIKALTCYFVSETVTLLNEINVWYLIYFWYITMTLIEYTF